MINDGVFSTAPALPYNGSYKIDPSAITVAGIFNERNIITDGYRLTYLDFSERQDFKVVVTYREMPENNALVKSLLVRWDEEASLKVPQEEVDLTGFCTSQEHAEMVARFLLSIRRRIDHRSVQDRSKAAGPGAWQLHRHHHFSGRGIVWIRGQRCGER